MITALDMQEMALRYIGSDNNNESVLDVRNAINSALKDLWSEFDWTWYQQNYTMILSAPYETGTVSFTASTRRFTLTTGTWPEWADNGTIVVGGQFARVHARISDTIIEIEEGTQFTENLAAGQTYRLLRNEYPLPNGVRKISYMANDNYTSHVVKYVTSLEWTNKKPTTTSTARPMSFTVQKDRRPGRGLNMVLWPFPQTAMTLRFAYVRAPEEVAIWSYSEGKVTTTALASTVTGLATAFDETLEGSVFRLGRDGTNIPTPSIGLYPPLQEVLVDSVTSTTSLSLADTADFSKTGVRYVISSLLDIDPTVMKTVFERLMYLRIAEIRNKEAKDYSVVKSAYEQALYKAINAVKPASQITYAGQKNSSSMCRWYDV